MISEKKYIVAIDQGTTSCRVMLYDHNLEVITIEQESYPLEFPKEGWVEASATLIWSIQEKLLKNVLNKVNPTQVHAIGITNQRETTVVWDKSTGKPIYNSIIWQDQRTSGYCNELKKDKDFVNQVQKITGLVIDSYFSATKLQWILENSTVSQENLMFGTIDSWLLWNMTRGEVHATDTSNASRTMLYDIRSLKWSQTLLSKFGVDQSILPEVLSSDSHFGDYQFQGVNIPIRAIMGDQQAALFGQNCFRPGMVKNTYGTGCFMLMNTGEKAVNSKSGLLATIAWTINGKTHYALEGSIFVAGTLIHWLRDNLNFIKTDSDSEKQASLSKIGGVYFVPAFSGLGAPFWNMNTQGAFFGLTREVKKEDLTRATLEDIGWRSCDLVYAMSNDANITINKLLVDGGVSTNNYLMQFQANMLGIKVQRPKTVESTSLGVAKLAGCSIGWFDQEYLINLDSKSKIFFPITSEEERHAKYQRWLKAIKLSQMWINE